LYVFGIGASLAALLGFRFGDGPVPIAITTLAIALTLFTLVCAVWLKFTETRMKRIRRLLGQHHRGSSDPATWTDEDCAGIPDSQEAFGYRTYEDAVASFIEKGDYSGAMLAARLSVVQEGRLTGEQLTTRVLRHPAVKSCLAAAEENPRAWLETLQSRRAGWTLARRLRS
jgi:hypothetical protein